MIQSEIIGGVVVFIVLAFLRIFAINPCFLGFHGDRFMESTGRHTARWRCLRCARIVYKEQTDLKCDQAAAVPATASPKPILSTTETC